LLAVLVGLAFVLWLRVGFAYWAAGGSPDNATVESALSEVRMVASIAVAASAVVAGLALWRRLWVTGVSQALVVVAACLFLWGGALADPREAPVDPAPASDHDGPGRPCLSGGDSDECRYSGG
jgi:hypothetical protein